MTGEDAELDLFRNGINCAALLERLPPPWRLDRKESTRRALKYRRGKGEVLIVSHEGRGWWDPQSTAKGDIFALVQYLDPGLNFGQVRKVLRPFVGIAPTFPEALRIRKKPDRPLSERWSVKSRLRPGSPAWGYLTEQRALPADILTAAAEADVVREGPFGSAWFAHRDVTGAVTHVEIRGPDYRGSLRGGQKRLFRLAGDGGKGRTPARLAVTEAPIDALSLAALEGMRPDTLYAATGGGMGPETVQAIQDLLAGMVSLPSALLASATDANVAGEGYAARHAELAAAAAVRFERLTPTVGADWNDVLRHGRRG